MAEKGQGLQMHKAGEDGNGESEDESIGGKVAERGNKIDERDVEYVGSPSATQDWPDSHQKYIITITQKKY